MFSKSIEGSYLLHITSHQLYFVAFLTLSLRVGQRLNLSGADVNLTRKTSERVLFVFNF